MLTIDARLASSAGRRGQEPPDIIEEPNRVIGDTKGGKKSGAAKKKQKAGKQAGGKKGPSKSSSRRSR